MNYIRDYYKFIIFNVIKTRADPINITNLYTTFVEIIQELHSYFNDFNKFTLCDTKLYNPAFTIKNNETFNLFYVRFLAIVVLLSYIEFLKIRAL